MFFESISSATLANGVVRLDTLYRTAAGEDQAAGQLLIPANRLTAVIASLQEIARRLEHNAQQGAVEVAGTA